MAATWVGVLDAGVLEAVPLAEGAEVAAAEEVTAAVAAEVVEVGAEAEVAAEVAEAMAPTEVAIAGASEAEAEVVAAPGALVRAGLAGRVEILQEM